ncbi:flagellar hook-basal body complex protein FliE [Sporolactobacillus pectinivorans]|uniref:flagellar hook-basal body complex protein FliE n=1 Tax=Sporolactobacillus pectinivorans TaxID=1591408 RepID=UPI001EFCAA2B|nr:flagellar hook-basal body complex protein FliE [Sporolactobacillus pectinivorans]
MSINPINLSGSTNLLSSAPHSVAGAQASFSDALKNALGTVNNSVQTADNMVTGLANGNSNEDLHSVMIAMQKADTLLQTAVQVRDRVISAYQDIMNMQV